MQSRLNSNAYTLRCNCHARHARRRVVQPSASASGAVRWEASMSRRLNLSLGVEECIELIKGKSADIVPEFALAFVSSAHRDKYSELVSLLRQRMPSLRTIVGCSGFGVLGSTPEGAQEVENMPAVSLTLASLPKTQVSAKHITPSDLPDGDAGPEAWGRMLGLEVGSSEPLSFVVLADPAFEGLDELLAGLDFAFPNANKTGGLSSAGSMSSLRALFCWDAAGAQQPEDAQQQQQQQMSAARPGIFGEMEQSGEGAEGAEVAEASAAAGEEAASTSGVFGSGAVVLSLQGGVVMESLIAQGCRPVTDNTWAITKLGRDPGGRPVIVEVALEGARSGVACTPMEALQQDISSLRLSDEQQLLDMLQNLTLGLAPTGQDGGDLEAHQYLIRGLMPLSKRYILVGDRVSLGQSIRFMVRDRQGAEDDLQSHGLAYKRQQLQEMVEGRSRPAPFGVLAFTCNGRGVGLFQEPHHDAASLQQFVAAPLAGFMCNGEIARVGDTTRLHGFTCSTAILREVPLQVAPATAAATDNDGNAA